MLLTDFRLAATCSLNRRSLSRESKGDLVAGDSTNDGLQVAVAGVVMASLDVPAGVRLSGAGLDVRLVEPSREGVLMLAELGVREGFNGELTEGVA